MKASISSARENRRREYLALMDIQPWYARRALVNAKASPVYELAPAPAPDSPPGSPPGPAPASASRQAADSARATAATARNRATRRGTEHEPRREAGQFTPQDKASAAPPPAAQSAAIALRKPLHYLALDESLALLSDAPWESADHAESRQLLANILRALGKELVPDAAGELAGPAVPPGDPKSHPRARQNKRDTSPAAPLENLCRRDRCANLLIFAHYGNDLFPDLAPTTTDFRRDIGGIAMRVTVTRGLREMIAFPNLKKQCWQQLQPLRARLN